MSEQVATAGRRNVFDAIGQPSVQSSTGRFVIAVAEPAVRFSLRMEGGDAGEVQTAAGFDVSQAVNHLRQSAEGQKSMRLGPDEWLLIAPASPDPADILAARLAADIGDKPYTLTDISHRNVALELRGALSADVLNTGCPLDLSQQAFPPGTATRTLFAKAEIILCRCPDNDHQPLFRVESWRSFGRYMHAYLQQSAELIGAAS